MTVMIKIARIKKAVKSFSGKIAAKTGVPKLIKNATKTALRSDRVFLAAFISTLPMSAVLIPLSFYIASKIDFSQKWMFPVSFIAKILLFALIFVIAFETEYSRLKRIHRRWLKRRDYPPVP